MNKIAQNSSTRTRALGFKQAMPIQVPKSPVPLFPEKSSRMYKQHNDI